MPAKPSQKVVIVCGGIPSSPSKRTILEFFAKKGYWAIAIRYRGSWESKGVFLKQSPHQDVLDVLDELPKGFTDLWTKKKFKLHPKKIFVVGTSFGGAAALLASRDPRVDGVIALAPVVDWSQRSKDEPLPRFVRFMKEAYGEAYRTKLWHKLGKNNFYEPTGNEDGSKIVIIHAQDDKTVDIKEVKTFARKTKSNFILLKRGGHLSTSVIMRPALWKKVKRML